MNNKKIRIVAICYVLALAGIIIIDLLYPFIHGYESHALIAAAAVAAAILTSSALKVSPKNDLRPFHAFFAVYFLIMVLNVFLPSSKVSTFITDIVSKDTDVYTRKKDATVYYVEVRLPGAHISGLKETVKLRLNKASFSKLDPEKYQARVTVPHGFFRLPYVEDYKFLSKK